ncbi:MAG TPA: alanine racemase [Candidatus Limnocylindrales bacterium]|nr:alanine racemase [Candidatus Limnocylindrales bacterium]
MFDAVLDRLPIRHPAWIEIDRGALVHNARVLRRSIPEGCRLGLLVKANGYGHGLEMAARAAVEAGADQLIVANADEWLALRAAGIDAPILVVYPIPPGAVAEAVAAGLELSVGGLESVRRTLDAWARRRRVGQAGADGARLHVEVDTGMGRGGIAPEAVPEAIALVDAAPDATLTGIWTHLADGSDPAVSRRQTNEFTAVLDELAATGRPTPLRHVAATEGILVATAPTYDMVRVGLGYYGEIGLGVRPAAGREALAAELRPAMSVKARPVRLETIAEGGSVGYGGEWTAQRRSLVATLPIGYADGWSRSTWPGAEALVGGRRVPLIGRVSMDSVCADVTEAGTVTLDDEFVLLGRQGHERITAADLARQRGTIPNEIFCSFGLRLPRVYLEDGRVVAVSRQVERIDRAGADAGPGEAPGERLPGTGSAAPS